MDYDDDCYNIEPGDNPREKRLVMFIERDDDSINHRSFLWDKREHVLAQYYRHISSHDNIGYIEPN